MITVWARALAIALLIVAVVCAILVVFLARVGPPAAAPSKQIALCSNEPGINDKINELAFQALDDSLRKQIENLFTTWMKDDAGQPERAATGVRRSALAYIHARRAIIEWNVPPC